MNGKQLNAITVFSKALQYMKKIVLEDLDKQVQNPLRSILWILTVPAIWSHAAKQVMRIAAREVHIIAMSNYNCELILEYIPMHHLLQHALGMHIYVHTYSLDYEYNCINLTCDSQL